jgi:hypothetical protein
MQRYQQKPVMAVQWFPGVVIEGVSEIERGGGYVLGYRVGRVVDIYLDHGDWLLIREDGTDYSLMDWEFKEQYDPV